MSIHPIATLLQVEINKYYESKKKIDQSFYNYSLGYYGLFSSGNRYCYNCKLKYPKFFDDFCELCDVCQKCCKNTADCWKYR